MRFLNLVKCEFIKNYTLRNILLIGIVLFISVIAITEDYATSFNMATFNAKKEAETEKYQYQNLLEDKEAYADNLLRREFMMQRRKNSWEAYEELAKVGNEFRSMSWQHALTVSIIELENRVFVINQMQEHPDESFETEIKHLDEFRDEGVEVHTIDYYVKAIETIKNQNKDLKELKQEYQNEIHRRKEIIKENKFYKYIEYRLERFQQLGEEDELNLLDYSEIVITEESKKYYEKIVSDKIEDEYDFKSLNILQLQKFRKEYEILSEKALIKSGEEQYYKNYDFYLKHWKFVNNSIKSDREILKYSIEHHLKHDLSRDYQTGAIDNGLYISTKGSVNKILHMPVVILILVILTSCGIISKEHSNKTDKALLTSPFKRSKIVFYKFIYLIMHTYIIWLFAFLMIIIYAGIRFGFSDLFTPKLIYQNGSVHEVNYILYMLWKILINGLPVIAMVSIIFMLSTITLSTVITVGITTIITVLSPLLWQFILHLRLYFLIYTPFPYIDFALANVKDGFFLGVLDYTNVSPQLGLIVSIITIIFCYAISSIIYIKRDIKN